MWLVDIFLQIKYRCSPKDNENLERLQKDIQDRINHLKENNLNSNNDPQLLEYYELHEQIQQCLFADHTDQYLLIAAIVAAVGGYGYFRWKMIKRNETKR